MADPGGTACASWILCGRAASGGLLPRNPAPHVACGESWLAVPVPYGDRHADPSPVCKGRSEGWVRPLPRPGGVAPFARRRSQWASHRTACHSRWRHRTLDWPVPLYCGNCTGWIQGHGAKGEMASPFLQRDQPAHWGGVDGWLSPCAVVPFMYTATEYADGMRYASRMGSFCGVFVQRQRDWCDGALEAES